MSRMLLAFAALALALCGSASATRVIDQPEGAYEVKLQRVIMPGSTAGTVIFSPCDGCDSVALSVSSSTSYFVKRTQLPLADFLQTAEQLRQIEDGESTAVFVFYDVASKRVNRLVLSHLGD